MGNEVFEGIDTSRNKPHSDPSMYVLCYSACVLILSSRISRSKLSVLLCKGKRDVDVTLAKSLRETTYCVCDFHESSLVNSQKPNPQSHSNVQFKGSTEKHGFGLLQCHTSSS